MLPSHLIDPTKKKNERLSHTRLGEPPPPPMPSLCVTGALSQIGRLEVSPGVSISYCIFRPRQLHDLIRPPLVVVHGGPSIPSNYLLPIVNGVTDRSVIFYDQFGCGKSSRPRNAKEQGFSIELMVKHLEMLITKQWALKKYFLLGHSFGGILAYEYLVSSSTENAGPAACQGLILASAPTSSKMIQEESKRLYRSVNGLNDVEEGNDDILHDTNNSGEDRQILYQYSETYRQTHECRLAQLPLALEDAMAQAGPTPWRGIPAIPDYEAHKPLSNIPTLLLRGEYDFCSERCMDGWDRLFTDPAPQRKILTNCSHYGMLEDERQFGVAVQSFLADNRQPSPAIIGGR
jgi:proline-specific peptidase